MGFARFVLQDFKHNRKNTKGRIILFFFRIANYSTKNKVYKIIFSPYRFLYKFITEWIMGIEIPYNLKVGSGFRVYHFHALVINSGTVIGENCTFRHSTTIGNARSGGAAPTIGNNVEVGANVCIIGAINIGDNVVIGAGTVVTKDVPPNAVVVGERARILERP